MGTRKLSMSEPLIYTYNIYGSIFSMISDDPAIWPWVYNNFIQIKYVVDWRSFYFDNHYLLFDNCPWLTHSIIPRRMLESSTSLVNFIIECINNKSYIYLYIDRYYISKSSVFNTKHIWHELLIYGYDLDNKVFYIADNLGNGKYIKTECTFNELEKGYWAIDSDVEFYHNIHLFDKHYEDGINLDTEQILLTLENYLFSKKTINMYVKEKTLYGIDTISLLMEHLGNCSSGDLWLDTRAFHLFWEHKKLMVSRLEYLKRNSNLVIDDKIIEGYESLKNSYLINRNLALKFNTTRNYDLIVPKLIHNISSALTTEKRLLGEFLDVNR